jgi:hypothetical protein
MLNVTYAECHYDKGRYAECHYAECRYSECHGTTQTCAVLGSTLRYLHFVCCSTSVLGVS